MRLARTLYTSAKMQFTKNRPLFRVLWPPSASLSEPWSVWLPSSPSIRDFSCALCAHVHRCQQGNPLFKTMVYAFPIFSHTNPGNCRFPIWLMSNLARVQPKCLPTCSLFINTYILYNWLNWVSFLQVPSTLLQMYFLQKWFLSNSWRPVVW